MKTARDTRRPDRWSEEDDALDREFGDVIDHVRRHQRQPSVPSALNRRIRAMAGLDPFDALATNWLLGQAPRAVLVILVFASIALAMWLALFA